MSLDSRMSALIDHRDAVRTHVRDRRSNQVHDRLDLLLAERSGQRAA
jgi:hypothetical protein